MFLAILVQARPEDCPWWGNKGSTFFPGGNFSVPDGKLLVVKNCNSNLFFFAQMRRNHLYIIFSLINIFLFQENCVSVTCKFIRR